MFLMISSCTIIDKPFVEVGSAVIFVKDYNGKANNLKLLISDSMNDPMGINMTIITDSILDKGFLPNGFEQKNGYRVYKYTLN